MTEAAQKKFEPELVTPPEILDETPLHTQSANKDGVPDIQDLIEALRRRWTVIVGTAALIVVAAILVLVNMTKLYTATSLILIEARESQVIDLGSVISGLPSDSAAIDSEVELLRSQSLVERVVEELNLIIDPEFNVALRESNSSGALAWLNPRNWVNSVFPRNEIPRSAAYLADRENYRVVLEVQDRLHVNRRGLTYVIEVSFTSMEPAKAATIANAFANLYIVEQLESRFEATRQANVWLSDRLATLQSQVQAAEEAAATFAAENGLTNAGGVTITEQQLIQVNQQLVAANADRAEAEATYDRVRQLAAAGAATDSLTRVLESNTISRLREQQAELTRREAEFAGRYGDRHPEIINTRQEIRELDGQIRNEIDRIVAGLEGDVTVARSRERALRLSLTNLETERSGDNRAMIRLRELERNAFAQRALYEEFLSRFNETSQQEGMQAADARIFAQARSPFNPSHPRAALSIAIVGVFGVFAGLGVAFLLEWFDRGLRTREQVESYLNLPLLAAVPDLDASALMVGEERLEPEDYVIAKPLSAFSESIRTLNAAIEIADVNNPIRVVLVTSSLPNEGKTTTALSLARAAAYSGKKTLLVDADLRHPSIHEMLGINQQDRPMGLVDILANEIPMEIVAQKDTLTDLIVVQAGRQIINPADILRSERMQQFLAKARQQYDLVIVDSAPTLAVLDSRVLARVVDATLFVAKSQDTARDVARNGVRHLQDFGARIVGVALTMVDLKKQGRYGYHGGGYYYNQCKDYYGE